jgi:hypothetical protein
MLQDADMKRVAAQAKVDLRTVRAAYKGKKVKPVKFGRISAAAQSLGLHVPQDEQEPDMSGDYSRAFQGWGGRERPWMRLSLPGSTGTGIKPSLKAYVELPIQVQHAWESYSLVDEAIAILEETGQFQNAAMLCDAARSDDRVTGVFSTRVNAVFGLHKEFRWQGQEEHDAEKADRAPTAAVAPPVGQPPQHASPPKPAPGQENSDSRGSTAPVAPPIGSPPIPAPPPPAAEAQADPEDRPEVVALKQKVCKFVEDNWERMLPTATGKECLGWALMLNAGIGENVWAWEGDYVIPTLKTWHPQFLYWRWDTRSYWLIHQGGQVELAPGDGRWVFIAPFGHNHGWLYGLIRAIGKLWIDRMFLWRDWARAAEKFALGMMKVKVPQKGNQEDKLVIKQALANVSSETSVFLPQSADGKDSYDIEMLETESSGVNGDAFFETRLKRIDTSMAVCVLGQNLTTDISGTAGSRAAAQVHENVRADFLKADVEVLQDVIRVQLLNPLVRYNFEADAEALGIPWECLVPEVTFKVDPPEDQNKTADSVSKVADAIQKLVSSGAPVDVHALLSRYEVPVVDQKKLTSKPPPMPGGNERPRGPGGTLPEDMPPGIGNPPRPDGSADQPLEQDEAEEQRARLIAAGFNEKAADSLLAIFKMSFRHELARRAAIGNRSRQSLKPGGRKGQLLVDDVADAAKRAGAKAMADRSRSLLKLVDEAKDYDDLRAKVKAYYRDLEPGQLRAVVEKALLVAELTGHLSARVDHRVADGK